MATLIRPPPNDPSKSSMENTLELLQLSDIDPNLFTNARPLWRPPGARGVYGGAVIAQCLGAAQKTVSPEFAVHSMHCYFVLAGNADIPIIYHVERVRDGKSFATRTVQARQRAKAIFTVTLSFTRQADPTHQIVQHQTPMPAVSGPDVHEPDRSHGPFESRYAPSLSGNPEQPYNKRTRMWLKTRGHISDGGGHEPHLEALAYMSDSFFIGTVARAHNLWRTPSKDTGGKKSDGEQDETAEEREQRNKQLAERILADNGGHTTNVEHRPEIGMMVSLDHTIFFHRPREFRADEWLLSEMETPWAGDNRGLVAQKVWSRDGKHIATCFQEGLVRLKQHHDASKL